uniref:Coiled-coil domain-containing protein 22 homolog n=1 Tax=Caenorhabditis tropicalis TaxID=1561998 RepID=A0A1I7SZG0_9PELO
MEEADAFIKEACKHIQCSFADDDDIEFSTPQIFEFLVRCIWKIDPNSRSTIPSYIYPNVITSRLHLGNAISNYLQKFHIRGDTALHTVLYGNINNLRSAFIELIRKLPVDATEISSQDQGQQFLESIIDNLESQPKWVPAYCRGLNNTLEWKLPDNHPEKFPFSDFDKPATNFDPRQWIAQYITSSHTKGNVELQRPKPALPPKPVFAEEQKNKTEEPVEEPVEVTEKVDENAVLQAEYEMKLEEYRKLQLERSKIEKQNEELQSKLSEYDAELIEALNDPEHYVEQIAIKIGELNKQMEEDTLTLEKRQQEAVQRKLLLSEEMKKLGTHDEEMRRVNEMENALEGFDEQLENNKILAHKLRKKLAKTDENQEKALYDYEKRSKELDELVRKQESDLLKRQEERVTLRKQEERDSEAVNRSFAIIYNILLQHCDHYRGRLAMESFTRIHLYCMEILEMLRENGALKQAVGLLESEITVEEQKQYGKQFELLNRDYDEINNLNEQLLSEIKLQQPDFQMPAV